jgi:hybrid cluster-associated redox disulfide protein
LVGDLVNYCAGAKTGRKRRCTVGKVQEGAIRQPDFHDPDLPLAELFRHWPEAAVPFFKRRMLCPSCPVASFYTLTEACLEYGQDETELRREIVAQIFGCKS